MKCAHFYELTRSSRKILVPDLGFLGDTLHLIPALREIRDAYPHAELHVMAAEHVKDLLRLVPWIERAWGYPRFPSSPPWHRLFPLFQQLRCEHFDAVINLNGSSRSSFLTAWTGATYRLGRLPERTNGALWTHLYSHQVSVPDDSTPVFEQRRTCLQLAGIPVRELARWDFSIPFSAQEKIEELVGKDRSFIHVSPFTTMDSKEIEPAVLAGILNEFVRWHPNENIVLTCAPNPREQDKLSAFLPLLSRDPWKCFAGSLTALEACALIGRARLHLGGDSGGVHMAVMQKIPTIVWFKKHHPLSGWAPRGVKDILVFGSLDPETAYLRINPEEVVDALDLLLR